jgi:septal ring factor EnvC (AmiA/AmiB activator)
MKQNLQEEIKKLSKLMLINESELSAPVPIDRPPNSGFGMRKSGQHYGVDLWALSGTEVHSPDSGEVLVATFSNGDCGGTVTIKHPNGYQSRYCHLKEINVNVGDSIEKGYVIGLSGGNSGDKGTGNSRGAHLHFELKKDGRLVDPMKYISNDISTTDTPSSQSSEGSEEENELLEKILDSEFMGKKVKEWIDSIGKNFFEILAKIASGLKGIK